jgi:two-component system, OmpR family, osmolarity sensor histidine kinase EnvZ
MNVLPKSLFARLLLLMLCAVVIAMFAFGYLFRQDRASLVARNFTDEKVQQIEALREALVKLPDDRGPTMQPLAKEFKVIFVPVDRRPDIGQAPGPAFKQIVAHLQERLGSNVEVRWGMRLDQAIVWLRLQVTADPNRFVWAGFALRNPQVDEFPQRLGYALGGVLLALLAGTFWFVRRLTQPLSDLSKAIATVAEGKHPTPLAEDGPAEIAHVAKNVNKMASNLAQLETDRRTMLAGISHDIRTPLTRLRLASEISVGDAQQRGEMIADINEIDRIVNQFLDFARGEPSDAPVRTRVGEAVAHVLELARARGFDVARVRDDEAIDACEIDVYPAAFERIFANLIENAHRYGKPPVQLSVIRDGTMVDINVIDHGEGVAAEDAERLKQPFVRGDAARGGAMGAGLGLAIVDRLAKWHGAHFDIARRAGGGNVARVRFQLIGS